MPRETFRDVHIDRPLSNFSVAHFQNTADYVAQRFFPTMSVQFISDKFTFYPSGYFNRIFDGNRAEEGIANTIAYKTIEKSYHCEEQALRVFISDRKRSNVDSQRQLDREAAILLTMSLLLHREKWFVEEFMTAGKWTTNFAGVTATPGAGQLLKWSDSASDPVKDMLNIHKEMLRVGKRKPNKAIMTLDVYNSLRGHPDIMDRIRYTGTSANPAQASMNSLAQLFELDEILIMQTVLNTAPDGIEDATTGMPPTADVFMAENKMLLAYVQSGLGLMAPVAGLTFMHNRYLPQSVSGGPAVRRYRETPAKKGEYIEAEYSMDQRIVAPDLGCLISDII